MLLGTIFTVDALYTVVIVSSQFNAIILRRSLHDGHVLLELGLRLAKVWCVGM